MALAGPENQPQSSAAAKMRPRLSAVVDVLLVFAVFAVCGSWPVPDSNEAHYLTKAKHFWEPHWLEHDLFLSGADSHVTFFATVGALTHWLPLPAAAWCGRAITWFLMAWGWRRLSWTFVPKWGWAALTAAAAVALNERLHMAGEWFVGGLEAKGPAYALVFFGLAEVLRARWNRGLLLLGAAAAFHVLVGGWSVAAAGVVWLADRRRPALQSIAPGLLGGGVLALAGIVPGLALARGVDPETAAAANQIYVFERIAHHLWACDFLPKFGLRHFALYVVFAGWCWAIPADDARRRLRWFVAAAAGFSVVGVGISYASPEPTAWAAAILKYYWFRLSDVAVALGTALELAAFAAAAAPGSLRRRAVLTLLILAGTAHMADTLRQRSEAHWLPRGERITDPAHYANWLEACAWIREHTPREALVLSPRSFMTFKWYAERAEFASWKDVPQDARSLVLWKERLDELYDDFGGWVNYVPPDHLRAVCRKYGVTHIVAYGGDGPLEFEALYRNNSFVVYRVEPQ